MKKYEQLGVCGLYCGACYHYCASLPEGEHLLEQAAQRGCQPQNFTCWGCRSDALYIHSGCSQCEMRACADNKGLLHCGQCSEYPCRLIVDFQGDGRIHHIDVFDNLAELNEKGADQWLVEQEKKWKCQCGQRFSWYEEYCQKCGAKLGSYGPDPTIK